jgi:hypothetical protein
VGKVVNVKFEGTGEIELTLPKTMISGISAIQVGDVEGTIEYAAVETTIRFIIPQDAAWIDIMGLHVVPEFMRKVLLEGGLFEYYKKNKQFPWSNLGMSRKRVNIE